MPNDRSGSYTFLSIDDPAFGDQQWQEFSHLLQQLHEKYHSPFSQTPWMQLRERYLSFLKTMSHYRRFVMYHGATITGWGDFQVRNFGTPHQTARLHFDAHYDRIPEDVATALGGKLLRLLTEYECSTIFLSAVDERISGLARLWQAKELSRVARYRLRRSEANHEVIETWLRDIPRANPDLHLEIFRSMPVEHLQRFAELLNQFANDMPKERDAEKPFYTDADELRQRWQWREQNNVRVLTAALLDRDDQVVAFSYCALSLHDPGDAHQAMTGVERSCRGRNLSKWLKAALFREVGEDFPQNQTMTTEMRSVNEPIQRVNKQMGYQLESQGAEFEISAGNLREFLLHILGSSWS